MLDFLGIESNEKRVMLSAATEDKTKALIAGQRERLHLGVPGHGIVIAVPMKSVGGGKTMEFLKGNEAGTGKYTPELNFAYEAKTEEKTAIMRSILEKAGPDTPAKAIAFSLPTTEVAGFGFYRNNEA